MKKFTNTIIIILLFFNALLFSQSNTGIIIGTPAPNFVAVDIDGNQIKLSDFREKVVVLNFWFTTCAPCVKEIPELNKVYDKFKNNKEVVFISITFDTKKQVNKFLKKHSLKFIKITDSRNICNLNKVEGYPTNVVIDKKGIYHSYIYGVFDKIEEYLSDGIQDALEDKAPREVKYEQRKITIRSNSKIIFENGKAVEMKDVMELLNSGKYMVFPKKDENGEEYFLFKKN